MNHKIVSSFAAGILFATSVASFVYFISPTDKSVVKKVSKVQEVKPSEKEMISDLKDSGYVILTKDELDKKVTLTTVENANRDEEKVIYRTILTVSPGMTSIDVGNALVSANIIENAMDFFYEVEKRGLSSGLKPGSFEVDSQMSLDEIMAQMFK